MCHVRPVGGAAGGYRGHLCSFLAATGFSFFANPHSKKLRFWSPGRWVGGFPGFCWWALVDGWVQKRGFLDAKPQVSQNQLLVMQSADLLAGKEGTADPNAMMA